MAEKTILFAGARFQAVPGGPEADAMVVRGDRVLALGTRAAMRAVTGPGAREIDLAGGLVRPGFHDAHTHLSAGSVDAFARLDLREAVDAADAARRAAAQAKPLPPGAWVRGFGWDHTRWPGTRWPSRESLDEALPERPAFLVRVDGHAAWLNGAALAAIGAPEHPTGILLEEAMEQARASLPADPPALRRAALREALARAVALGLVAVEDVAEPWAPALYASLAQEGELPLRVGVWLPGDLEEDEAESLRQAHPPGDPWVSVSTRKLFLDGTLGSRTAALRAPYADAPETRGALRFAEPELRERVAALATKGWAVALHAIGDAAVDQAARVLASVGRTARRHRIEHLQVVAHESMPVLARSGAGASVQPVHFTEDRPWIGARLNGRDALVYPWRSLRAAGVPLAFGTDWPIAPLDPLLGLAAAAGREGEGLREDEAWSAYTRGSAAVAGWEAPRGTLLAGAFADFVVLEGEGGRVGATWVGGRQVH
jgi:predicted amidohydrolase YtcJ